MAAQARRPNPDATVIGIAADPLYSRYPVRGFLSHINLAGDVALSLGLLADRIGAVALDAGTIRRACRRVGPLGTGNCVRRRGSRPGQVVSARRSTRRGSPIASSNSATPTPSSSTRSGWTPHSSCSRAGLVLHRLASGCPGLGHRCSAGRQAGRAREDRGDVRRGRVVHVRRAVGGALGGASLQPAGADHRLEQRQVVGRGVGHAQRVPGRLGGAHEVVPVFGSVARRSTSSMTCARRAGTANASKRRVTCRARSNGRCTRCASKGASPC